VWDPRQVEWWLEIFDGTTEDVVAEYLLSEVSEEEIRSYFLVSPDAEPLDGIAVSADDVPWLSGFTAQPIRFDPETQTAFVCVHARPRGP
jgi:hypothetical protein